MAQENLIVLMLKAIVQCVLFSNVLRDAGLVTYFVWFLLSKNDTLLFDMFKYSVKGNTIKQIYNLINLVYAVIICVFCFLI